MSAPFKGMSPGSVGLLEPFSPYLNDPTLSELLINKPGEIWVENIEGMKRLQMDYVDEQYMRRLFMLLANENSQELSDQYPALSGELYDGSRIQCVMPPLSRHYTLSIRKKSLKKRTFEDYRKQGFFDDVKLLSLDDFRNGQHFVDENKDDWLSLYHPKTIEDFVYRGIQLKKTMVICGGTSTGKTTFLDCCGSYIPKYERIITLEDTYEVSLPHENQVNLKAPENSRFEIYHLLKMSLRLRPDRLIVGELRDKEVLDFISACSTGHDGSIATIHASTPLLAIQRMVQLYKRNNVPSMRDEEIYNEITSVVDCFVQLYDSPKKGRQVQYVTLVGERNEP